jgi:hypothetical protein
MSKNKTNTDTEPDRPLTEEQQAFKDAIKYCRQKWEWWEAFTEKYFGFSSDDMMPSTRAMAWAIWKGEAARGKALEGADSWLVTAAFEIGKLGGPEVRAYLLFIIKTSMKPGAAALPAWALPLAMALFDIIVSELETQP